MTAPLKTDAPEINIDNKTDDIHLETALEHQKRWFSVRIMYFTVFLMSLGFSIVITGVWPYLHKLDQTAGKEWMGLVVAANPLAQMLFSPLIGWWANRLGSTKLPFILTILVFIFSNGVYSSLEIFTHHRRYWMLITRLFVGISSANIAICRSYVSAATKLEERTGAVSMISLAQVLGFIVGPGLQAAVTPLGKEGVELLGPNRLALNMYTAAGWINVLLGIINLTLFGWFREKTIAAKEMMLLSGAASEKAAWKGIKPDYVSAWTLIAAFFVLTLNFVLLETLGVSLTMDQFAWNEKQALSYLGVLLSVGGIIACVVTALIGPISKLFGEVNVLLWGSFLLMFVGRAIYIPWGTSLPLIAYTDQAVNVTNGSEVVGCPESQAWCFYTPSMTIFQFLVGFFLTCIGYPLGITLIQTIFSKVLGPRPQGVWMGLMTGSGCLSRVVGPVFVSFVYTKKGTIWTFGSTALMMALAMFWLRLVQKRLHDSCLRSIHLDPPPRSPVIRADIELVDTTRDS